MASKLHEEMIQACQKIFPSFNDDRALRILNFAHRPLDGMNRIPDLAAQDNSLAIECETLGLEKRQRFLNHNKRYQKTLLILPLFDNVHEIWMYADGAFRKFTEGDSDDNGKFGRPSSAEARVRDHQPT